MFGSKYLLMAVAAALPFATVSCREKPSETVPAKAPTAAGLRTFQVNGVVRELKPDGKTVVIQHETVPDYMPAMTMPFEVRETNELNGLQPGDAIAFRMNVTDTDGWIDQIHKLAAPATAQPSPTPPSLHLTRDVDPLNLGDPLPEYHFTNELGQAISTSQFKGQALVFTFFFTRCPFPTFCPFLANAFEETQKKLEALPNSPANWHLLSISFDTDTDSPTTLKEYAGRYDYDPAHWSFATGDLTEITAIGDQVGQYFGRDANSNITHNLRTVVVDARGRIQKVFTDNRWTSNELLAEVVKAAARH